MCGAKGRDISVQGYFAKVGLHEGYVPADLFMSDGQAKLSPNVNSVPVDG